jgi:hypothetical protein
MEIKCLLLFILCILQAWSTSINFKYQFVVTESLMWATIAVIHPVTSLVGHECGWFKGYLNGSVNAMLLHTFVPLKVVQVYKGFCQAKWYLVDSQKLSREDLLNAHNSLQHAYKGSCQTNISITPELLFYINYKFI